MAVQLRFLTQQVPEGLVDLPWAVPLQLWEHPALVSRRRGLSRHTVRFVGDGARVWALKQTSQPDAEREYAMLRRMRAAGLPVVEAAGLVTGSDLAQEGNSRAILVTNFLNYSLPFRHLFGVEGGPPLVSRLIDAAVVLLVRVHIEGFYWGDCSLSNLLFRRDAGTLMAYLVDAETAERREAPLPEGLREAELELARENIAGGLQDLAAEGTVSAEVDVIALVDALCDRYRLLWNELTGTLEIDAGDRHLIDQRIRRINELGFDVQELLIEQDPAGARTRMVPVLVEEGHHARELRRLTGLSVQENQARRILNDITSFGAYLGRREGAAPAPEVTAARWMTEVYVPLIAAVPDDLRGRLEPPELLHELLEHRYYLSEAAGYEVANEIALPSYIESVLRHRPPEQAVLEDEGPDA